MGLFADFINLFYPNNCAVCHNGLASGEEVLCTSCLYHLPRTRFWMESENPVAQAFWGRVQIENACSLFFFAKGSKYQKLLHQLKYNGRQDIGISLGHVLGKELQKSELYSHLEAVVPVPLHPRKLRLRGYNQSEAICQGITETLDIPTITNVLIRSQFTQTQTKKNREERLQNVANAFSIRDPEALSQKNILLVDDVVTTGATLEVCANTILAATDPKISIATLAYASDF